MKNIFARIVKVLGQGILTLSSISLLLFFLMLTGAQSFVIWLNTQSGGDWLSHKIEQKMVDSPYQITIKGLSLQGLFSVRAGEITVSQSQKAIGSIKNISLGINPFPLILKSLSVDVNIGEISLIALPETKSSEDRQPSKTDIQIADIYFSKGVLDLKIRALLLSDQIIKGGFKARIKTRQILEFGRPEIQLSGSTTLRDIDAEFAEFVPEKLTNKVSFDIDTQILNLSELLAVKDDNGLSASATYHLTDHQFDLNLAGQWAQTDLIHQDIGAPIDLSANVSGHIDDFLGKIATSSAYKAFPVTVSTDIQRTGQIIMISDMKGQLEDIAAYGELDYNLSSGIADGDLKVVFDNFDVLKTLGSVDIPLSGSGTASLKIFEGEGVQAGALDASFKNLRYEDVGLTSLSLDAAVKDVRDLSSVQADIVLKNLQKGTTTLNSASINAALGERDGSPHTALSVKGEGIDRTPFEFDASALIQDFTAPVFDIETATFKAGQGTITLFGRAHPDAIDLNASGTTLKVDEMPFVDLGALPLVIKSVTANLSGTYQVPVLQGAYVLEAGRTDNMNTSVNGNMTYLDNTLSTDIMVTGRGIQSLAGEASFPLALSLKPFMFRLQEDAALTGRFTGDFDMAALSPLFMNDTYDLRGDVDLEALLDGTLLAPSINGDISIRDGIFEDQVNDLYLSNIQGAASFRDKALTIQSLSANDRAGTGTLSAEGQINLENTDHPDLEALIKLSNMALVQNDQYDVRLNANMKVATTPETYQITGTIIPEKIDITLPERFDEAVPELNIVSDEAAENATDRLMEKIMLNILFEAKNQIFVRGWGLDAELGGELNVSGSAASPLVTGQLETIRGRYEELGRRFDVDHARLRFQGAVPPSPYLDVKTSTDIDDITVHILINGRAAEPELSFSSTPELPEDEVLSRILFGEDITQISAFQAIQLARTLRRFSGQSSGPSLDILGTLRGVTGLDDIRVEGIGTEDATVGAGKYISDGVYLEVEQGSGEGSGAASVEVEITPNITVESTTKQTGDSELGVFWEWNY